MVPPVPRPELDFDDSELALLATLVVVDLEEVDVIVALGVY